MKKSYLPPSVTDLGSLSEMTQKADKTPQGLGAQGKGNAFGLGKEQKFLGSKPFSSTWDL